MLGMNFIDEASRNKKATSLKAIEWNVNKIEAPIVNHTLYPTCRVQYFQPRLEEIFNQSLECIFLVLFKV